MVHRAVQEQEPCVLVGHDGTRRAEAVVDEAAAEAVRRRLPLTVVGVVVLQSELDPALGADAPAELTATGPLADQLAASAARVGRRHLDLVVSTLHLLRDAVPGSVPPARLLVVGTQGAVRTTFSVGTVSWSLLHAVDCPVMAVPSPVEAGGGRQHPAGPVVAGVGENPRDVEVVREAATAAAARRTSVELVHALHPRPGEPPGEEAAARGRALAAELVHRVRADRAAPDALEDADAPRRPDVQVTTVLSDEEPAAALRGCGARASLLVVGSRGPLALAGLVAGSVSRTTIGTAPCPVLVVVHRDAPAPRGRPVTTGAEA